MIKVMIYTENSYRPNSKKQ